MNYYLLLILFCSLALNAQHESVATQLFGSFGVDLEQMYINKIDELLNTLEQLNPDQLHEALLEVIPVLRNKHAILKKAIDEQQRLNAPIAYEFFLKNFIIEQQIDHLENAAKYGTVPDSLFKTVGSYLSEISSYLKSFVYTEKKISAPAQLLLDYTTIEQETILNDYNKVLLFLGLRRQFRLPSIIDFWQSCELQDRLKKRAQRLAKPKLQGLEIIATMAIQAAVLAGGSLAMQWEDQEDQKAFEAATAQQNQITADWQNFQTQLQNDQKNIMTSITTAFGDSQKKIGAEYEKNNQQLQEEILYLNRSINLNTPIYQALVAPITYDRYFANGLMLTPNNGYQWFNIYQFPGSDWQFDPSRNSFFQNGLAQYPIPPLWQKIASAQPSIFTDDPAASSIFTEYATGKAQYPIEIECTVINTNYPFFVGIMFNRGRWISGDPERIWQYRLIGLYGTEQSKGDPKTRKIDLCFAQQVIVSKKNNAPEKIISPLEQISKDRATHLTSLSSTDVDSLNRNATTFIFKISTSAKSVSCTLQKRTSDGKIVDLFSQNISSLDDYLFKFGGIGFMAAGAQAEFKIKQPQELIYTQDQLVQFEQQLAALMK